MGNSIQAYSTLAYTSRVYIGRSLTPNSKPSAVNSPVTPLSGRMFGTWTLIQSIVRLYAAYNIDSPAFYQLAFITYGVAFAHFTSEWLYFKSTSWQEGLAGPVIVSTCSLVWMVAQWGFYVK
jgi:hypothetical protein